MKLSASLTLMLVLLVLAACTTPVWLREAHGQSLTVETDKKAYGVGEVVEVRGTATPFAWVTIKVYDPNNNLAVIDQVRATAGGAYATSFRLPSTVPYGVFKTYGTYKVSVASGGATAEVTFEFTAPIPSFHPCITRDLPRMEVNVGEEFDVKLRYFSPLALPAVPGYEILEVKAYEVIPPGVEVVKAPGEIKALPLSEALTLLPEEALAALEGYRGNISKGIAKIPGLPDAGKYLPALSDKVTLLELSFDQATSITYTAKVTEAQLPFKLFHGVSLIRVETPTGEVLVSGVITGDAALKIGVAAPPKPKPVEVVTPTPHRISVQVNVTGVLEAKMGEVKVNVSVAMLPQLKEVSVVIDKTLPKGMPVTFNLTQALEAGRIVKELTLSVYDQSVNVCVSVHLPEKVKIVAPKPVESLIVKPSIEPPEVPKAWVRVLPAVDIGPSGIVFDKPVVVNFTYTDEAVERLGVDEKRLTIAFYDEKLGKWVTLESMVDTERNIVYAEVTHFTPFIVIQKPLPAEFKVANLVISPTEVTAGQAVEVSVEVANVGEEAGEYTVALVVNGVVEASKTITLAGGETATARFTVAKEQPGVYSVKINGLTGMFSVKAPPKPAEFKLSELNVSPSKVKAGEGVTVRVMVSNVGGQAGVKTVSLKVNGVVEATKDVAVKAGKVEAVTFTLVKKEPGTYTVEVDGLTGSFTVEAPPTPPPSRCIIATATYGSELAPEVQFLRGFRDSVVLSTFAGSRFMKAFNAWYYSWSPTVAGVIAQQPALKAIMRIVLYPLIGILHGSIAAYSAIGFNPELGIVVAGLVVSALIGVVYFAPVAALPLMVLKRRGKDLAKLAKLKALAVPWLGSFALTIVSVAAPLPLTATAATVALVLTTLSLSAWITAIKLAQRLP